MATRILKTFDELKKDLEYAEKKVKQYMPPFNKKKKTEDTPVQSGVTDKSFKKGEACSEARGADTPSTGAVSYTHLTLPTKA